MKIRGKNDRNDDHKLVKTWSDFVQTLEYYKNN